MKYFRLPKKNCATYINALNKLCLKTLFVVCVMSFSASSVWAMDPNESGLSLLHPYAAPTPPGATVAAGYLMITNNGDVDDRLVSARASFAKRTEIHEIVITNYVARMRQLKEGVSIPKESTIMLEPGATHLMFMGLENQLSLAERYEVTLVFEKSGEKVIEFVVEEVSDQKKMDHSKMDHSKM